MIADVQSSAFSEAFPNVVAEAKASAVPAVVTNVGDTALIVDDTDRVVAPRNSPQLAAAIESFLSQALQIRTATGLRDRERFASEYSLDKIVSKWDTLFEGSVDRQR